jgi:hypothetical protein
VILHEQLEEFLLVSRNDFVIILGFNDGVIRGVIRRSLCEGNAGRKQQTGDQDYEIRQSFFHSQSPKNQEIQY